MNIFFDTEFTGLHKNTTLISIGLVTETDATFYAEFTDYCKEQCDEWIMSNVVNKLRYNDKNYFISRGTSSEMRCKGNKEEVSHYLNRWLKCFDDIQFVSDVCHHDFVLLIDLISGHALKLPENICASCHDINQDIASFFDITEKEAFDVSREEMVFESLPRGMRKHNALYDARVIKAIYEKIHG